MPTVYNFDKVSKEAKQAIEDEFPGASMSAEEGWHGRLHLKIVSSFFDGKGEAEKQAIVWDLLKAKLGADSDGISLVVVYGFDEL